MRLPRLSADDIGRPKSRLRNPVADGLGYTWRQPLYDFYGVTVATAVTRQTLFQIPQGAQYTPAGGAVFAKNEWHTNMKLAGILPNPAKMTCRGLSVGFRGDTQSGDLNRFLYGCLLSFMLGSTGVSYCDLPLWKFPQGGGGYGASSSIVSNGVPHAGNFFAFEGGGELIEQGEHFEVRLDPTREIDAGSTAILTTAAAALGGTGINCFVYLDGALVREVR